MTDEDSLVLDFCLTNRKVLFKRSSSLNNEHWNELTSWWSNGIADYSERYEFATNLDDYLAKRSWFKTFWRANSRSVVVSSNLKNAISIAKTTSDIFEKSLTSSQNVDSFKLNLEGLKRTLTDQQKYNVTASLKIPSGANFSVPGAGKTTTTLAVWNHLVKEGSVDKLLVVCPLSVFDSWLHEELIETFDKPPKSQKFCDSLISSHTGLLIVNYEKLENEHILNKINNWVCNHRVMLVIDEAHRIKGGSQSVRWRACKKIADNCRRVDLLTGTPMPQGYDDIRNLFTLSWKNLPKSALTDQKLASLRPGGVFVRTTKEELNLPPVDIREIPLEPSDKQMQIYSALRRSYSGLFNMSYGSRRHLAKKGTAVMSLIAAASNPGLIAGREAEQAYLNLKWPPEEISSDRDILELVNSYIKYEIPPKYEWILRFIQKSTDEGKKTIIWSSFVGNIMALERLLKKYNPAIVCGGISGEDRRSMIERFRNNTSCGVLITNPHTLGEGISLHKECNQAVYLDRTFNAVHYLQSLDRIHRLGLKSDVVTKVYILNTRQTIDHGVDVSLKRKIDRMANSLNDESLNISTYVEYDRNEDLLDIVLSKEDESEIYSHLK